MIKFNFLYFLILITSCCFSQSSLNEIIQLVNKNKDTVLIDQEPLKFIKCSNSVESLLKNEKKTDNSSCYFKIYLNKKNDTIYKIKNRFYKFLKFDNNINVYFSDNASFFVNDKNKHLWFYITSDIKSSLNSENYPTLIEKISSIHFLNKEFNPTLSIILLNDFILTTSYFEYKDNFIYENIYLEKVNFENKEDNIINMNLKKLFYTLEYGPLPINYYRKIKIKVKYNKDLFWFLDYNKYIYE